jgi:hypothetical protein
VDDNKQPFRPSEPTDRYAAFEYTATSQEARTFVDQVHAAVLANEQQTGARDRARSQKGAEEFRDCVERLLANLLIAAADPKCTGWIGRSMKRDAYTGDVVSFRNMDFAIGALKPLGLVEHERGVPKFGPGFDPGTTVQKIGQPARFSATLGLVALAEQCGVKLDEVSKHFRVVREPIEARTSGHRWRDEREKGRRVKLRQGAHVQKLKAQVEELNEFLSEVTLEGGSHSSFYRVFNNVDDQSVYRFNEGGRLFSQTVDGSPSYQTLPSEQRALMRIDGELVAEVDLSACHLTILHSLMGQPLDLKGGSNPYGLTGLPPEIVKQWVMISLGAGKPCTRWPKRASERYAENDKNGQRPSEFCSASEVRDAVEATYPVLNRKAYPFGWALLQYVESEVIIGAMQALMHFGIPSYPVHDSLIVPEACARDAASSLCMSFKARVGVVPLVKTKNQTVADDVLQEREAVRRGLEPPEGAYEALEKLKSGYGGDDDYKL